MDDAQLQQFVNSKTQKPLSFTYKTIAVDGVKIGVIKIPLQARPFYLLKDFGKVKKKIVYVRRGSSTDEADPEEILNMGVAQANEIIETPNLTFDFGDLKTRTRLGNTITLPSTLLDIPLKVPDYTDTSRYDPFSIAMGSANRDFYRKLTIFYYVWNKFREIAFSITNNSQVTARDVKVEIQVEINSNMQILLQESLPTRPKTHYQVHDHIVPLADQLAAKSIKPDITIQNLGGSFWIEVLFEKVQPMQTVFTKDCIYIGSSESLSFELKAKIYADNIPNPLESNLNVTCEVQSTRVSLDEIIEMNNKDD